jgi:hypothetical protein
MRLNRRKRIRHGGLPSFTLTGHLLRRYRCAISSKRSRSLVGRVVEMLPLVDSLQSDEEKTGKRNRTQAAIDTLRRELKETSELRIKMLKFVSEENGGSWWDLWWRYCSLTNNPRHAVGACWKAGADWGCLVVVIMLLGWIYFVLTLLGVLSGSVI